MYLIRLSAEECCASGSINLKLCSCRKKKKKLPQMPNWHNGFFNVSKYIIENYIDFFLRKNNFI